MRVNKRLVVIFIIFLFSFTNFVYSQDDIKEEKGKVNTEEKSEYTPFRKMARGLSNVTLCWVEIPRQAIKASKKEKDTRGLFWGSIKGLTYTATRFCVGVYEIVTFLAPPYKPIVDPEFIFSEDEKEGD